MSPWEYVDFLWRRRVLILAVTVASAAVVSAVVLAMPRQYRAEATVFLTPPTYRTTLRPAVMSVEAYAELAETQHILALVNGRLRSKHPELFGSAQEGERAPLVEYSTRLSASREPQKPYLPLIILTAAADTPERARAAADAWADVFVSEQSRISALGTSNAAEFILREYPKVEKGLLDSENALRALLARQGRELVSLKSELGVSLKAARLESNERLVVEQEDALASARLRLARLRPLVEQLEKELAAVPQYLAGSQAGGQVNPVHVTLSQRLAEERVTLNSLGPQIEILEKQLETTRGRTVELRRALLDSERRLAETQGRHEVEAGTLQRAVESSRQSFEMLADKIGEARLALSEPDQDLKLGTYAGLPSLPSGPSRTLIVAAGAAAGFGFGVVSLLLLALLRGHQGELQARRREVPVARV